jgi:adenine-specific DNA-methyltransferase
LLFERAEQEIVLFLADGRREKSSSNNKCRINLSEVPTVEKLLSKNFNITDEEDEKIVNHDQEKWLKYFLTAREISFMRELRSCKDVVNLSQHATIDIGVVTGRNEFFVLSNKEIYDFDLRHYVIPLIGRTYQLKGAVIKKAEWQKLAEGGQRVFLFSIGPSTNSLSAGAQRYITLGEKRKIHTGYKCSIRNTWYQVPSIWIPDCFFFRQIYDFPRAILNEAKAISTDTIHRMTCKSSKTKLLPCIYTHLTAASAEIEGRSYGGGVLELEPTEAERLLMPKQLVDALPIQEIDHLIRIGRLEDALEENNRLVLMDGLGLNKRDCDMLKQIWLKMRDRRLSRKRRKKR